MQTEPHLLPVADRHRTEQSHGESCTTLSGTHSFPEDIIDESASRGHVKLQGGKGESTGLRFFFFFKSIGIFVNSPEEYQSN